MRQVGNKGSLSPRIIELLPRPDMDYKAWTLPIGGSL